MEYSNHITVWDNCLRIIEQIVDPVKFQTWFRPLRPVSLVGETLTLEVPSDFFREYLEGAYLDILKKTIKRVIGPGAQLYYNVRPVQTQPPMTFPAAQGTAPNNRPVSISSYPTEGNPGPFVFPGLQRIQINPRLNPDYNFHNLVEGECNKMGITAGMSISDAPGKTPFNPLFIFGRPGLGKTHLAQAVGLAIKEKYPDLVVLYVTGNEFKTQFMDATVKNKLTDFLAFYMKIEVLIVDDIQDMVGQGTQNVFFNIFNYLHESGKQLIFTSDRAPAELQNFEERLLSRMKWGLSVELRQPSYPTRLQMLRDRCLREGVSNISEDVLVYLATRIKTNFRELEGALVSLIAYATLGRTEVTVALAEKVTGKIVGQEKNDISIEKVQKIVCDYFNITRDALLSKSRKRQIVQARQIAMYMSRNLVGCSLSTIGAELGGKDHATVLHACTTVSDLMSTDKTFRQYVGDIERMLVPSGN